MTLVSVMAELARLWDLDQQVQLTYEADDTPW
jgi:hypothetical protein